MMSSLLLLNFTVPQLVEGWRSVNILSVFHDKLLVSSSYLLAFQLFIYSREGRHLSTITVENKNNNYLRDATWTPRGNIVYTTDTIRRESYEVVRMSESGKVINIHNQREVPWYLSVSNDGIIFLAAETSVYQSTDDGISWSRVFESTDGWHCLQVIKMTTDHSDDFWAWESRYSSKHLHVYSVDRRHSNGNVSWKDIDVRSTNNKHIDLSDIACRTAVT